MKRIVLHIDRLVLRGVGHADTDAVSAALRAELQGLLAQPAGAEAMAAHNGRARVQAGRAMLTADADACALGRAVAGRIVAGGMP